MTRPKAGRWRLLAHPPDAPNRQLHLTGGDFDEVVVGSWLHVEEMDTQRWWLQLGNPYSDTQPGLVVWIDVAKDGTATRITVTEAVRVEQD